MENNLSNIGDKTLTDIMIPGTHDAGSYEKYGPKSEDGKKYFFNSSIYSRNTFC
jgi:hypothetical protein